MKEMISIICIILLSGLLQSCKSESSNDFPLTKVIKADIPSKTEEVSVNVKEESISGIQKDKIPVKELDTEKMIKAEKNADSVNSDPTTKQEIASKQSIELDEVEAKVLSSKENEIGSKSIPEVISDLPSTDNVSDVEINEDPIIDNTEERSSTVNGQKEPTETEEKDAVISELDKPAVVAVDIHKEWDYLLKTYVSAAGKVNYSGLLSEKNRLESYLATISNNPPTSDWSRNKKLAYWINAYNAYTVKLIIDNYPLKSITDLENGKPWDKKWIKIGGKTYSLNNIENDIIRPDFKEPRIHFAVNCAAKSCPPLKNEAWDPERLEQQFEVSTKKFIQNKTYNLIDSGKAEVSKIFEWYAVDFGDLKTFLQKYSGQTIDKISYKDYDWSLNK